MKTTIDLLNEARKRFPTDAALCKALGISRTSVSVARTRGKTSAQMAGQLAMVVGLNPGPWMATADIENAPKTHVTAQLRRAISMSLNS